MRFFQSHTTGRTILFVLCCVFLLCIVVSTRADDSPTYAYHVVTTSNIDMIDSNVSINNNGYIAFLGTIGGKQNIYVSKPPYNSSYALMSQEFEFPTSGNAPTQVFSAPQINNANQVISRRFLTADVDVYTLIILGFPILQNFSVPVTYIESWDANKPGSRSATQIALADPGLSYYVNSLNTPVTFVQAVVWHPNLTVVLPSPFVNFLFIGGPLGSLFEYLPPFPIWQGFYNPVTINDGGKSVFFTLKSDPRDHSTDGNYLATANSSVTQSHETTDDTKGQQPRIANDGSVVFYEDDAIKLTNYGLGNIQAASNGVSSVGKKPGISKNGKLIAFSGTQGDLQGIFVRYPLTTGYQTVPVAYIGGDNSPQGAFQSFSTSDAVSIANDGTVVYKATSRDGKQGIFVSTITKSADTNGNVVLKVGDPIVVAKQGDNLNGTLSSEIQNLTLFDAINRNGQVAFWTQLSDGSQKVVVASNHLKITSARLRLGNDLEIKTLREFGFTSADVKFTLTVGGKDYEHIEPNLNTTTIPAAVNLNLRDMGVPRFSKNTIITLKVSAVLNGNTVHDQRDMVALLPIILIPGINPTAFHDGNDNGGDGTFAAMETFLKSSSDVLLQTDDYLGEGYYTQEDRSDPADPDVYRDYPTVYTLTYDRNNASFSQGAQAIQTLVSKIKVMAYADAVNIATHSKGGLVARKYLSAPFDNNGATVKQLIMTEPPNLGSQWAKLDYLSGYGAAFGLINNGYNYSNLYPLWPWLRLFPFQKFSQTPNSELAELNQQNLPANVVYTIIFGNGNLPLVPGTPLDFTRSIYNAVGGISGLYLATIFIDGDGIVPTFSQLGNMFDPNNPNGPMPLIPAFQGLKINRLPIAGSHIGYFDQQAVQAEIFSEFTSDLK